MDSDRIPGFQWIPAGISGGLKSIESGPAKCVPERRPLVHQRLIGNT